MVLKLSGEEAEKFVDKVNFQKMGGLVPVVIQDSSTSAVLMQAFMDRDALMLTLKTGLMHYWSRTRRRIWLKGETSGNFSMLENAILDCDRDAILFKVHQRGPCCHTGRYTCFHNPLRPIESEPIDARILEKTLEIIKGDIEGAAEEPYISDLLSLSEDSTIKILTDEVRMMHSSSSKGDVGNLVDASARYLFHTLFLLSKLNVPLIEVFKRLESWNRSEGRRTFTS